MTLRPYKHSILLIFLLGITVGFSQEKDKKTEKFKVDKNATLEINATHTDVTIESWNKNEILVEATIEIEGATEEQAENILENWNFEALGNHSRVEVKSYGNMFIHEMDGDYEFEFFMPEVVVEIPEFEIQEIEIVMPEFEFVMPEIEIPEFVIEIPEIEIEIEEFDFEKHENDSTYMKRYKEQVSQQVKAFKESGYHQKMDSLRESKAYKEQMTAMKEANKQMVIQMKAYKESKEYQEAMEASKHAMQQAKEQMKVARKEMIIQKEIVQKQRAVAREANEKARVEMKKVREEHGNIKIKRTINIKAPKDTKFDLNVKHGKLDVPESAKKMSARVSYGNFVAGTLSGEGTEVVVANSPVAINAMNAGNITLKNVPNAVFGTFSNANLFSNSSDVLVEAVGENVSISQKFGFIEINELKTDFSNFNLILDYAKAEVSLSNVAFKYQINGKNSTLNFTKQFDGALAKESNGMQTFTGVHGGNASDNTLSITGIYSTLTIN